MHITIYIVALILTGCVGGILSGFFGLGGGVLYVPVFITVFELFDPGIPTEMHTAIGTSLALLIPGSVSAVHKHIKSGNITLHDIFRWCIVVFLGALLGSVIIHLLSDLVLKIIFNVFMYGCIALLFLQKDHLHGAAKKVSQWVMLSYAFFVGTISVMLGIGGGTLTVPFYKILHHPYKRAVAISSSGAIVIGITGTVLMILSGLHLQQPLPRYSIGYVNWLAFICVAPFSVIFARFGAKWVTHSPEKVTKILYISVLSVLAAYMTITICVHYV
ncbi:MAG: sulfite exporter TauE/SafE family protein [Coxiellaceae bacterium]|nr:sulfite exporter TauE/SafE family protein [Coxiellaceae bacterium]